MATGGAASGLRRFELDGVHDTGREVGHGSYAVVKELMFRGLKCVGKKIHDILFNSATPQEQAALLERFAGECELISGLHHPCIVQFLGVCFEQGSPLPVLVMEYLHTTLSACLERYGVLPKEISYGILHDVALGLHYPHRVLNAYECDPCGTPPTVCPVPHQYSKLPPSSYSGRASGGSVTFLSLWWTASTELLESDIISAKLNRLFSIITV